MRFTRPSGPYKLGTVGAIFVIVFGILWTIAAYSMTKLSPLPMMHVIFPLFGLLFVGYGIANLLFDR